jgi:hypothetical protein
MSEAIKVPDVPAPTAVLCWKQSRAMVRCDRKAGHGGRHSWEGTVESIAEYVEHLRDDFVSTAEPVKKVARLIRERFKETGAEALAPPDPTLMREALEAVRWKLVLCGGCGLRYRRCVKCDTGVKLVNGHRQTPDREVQCGGHEDAPCDPMCIIGMALSPTRAEALAPPDDGWQPMDTAPQDGTYVLLCNADGYCEVGWSHGDYWGPIDEQGTGIIPTHWQPLPSPPRADAREAPPPPSAEAFLRVRADPLKCHQDVRAYTYAEVLEVMEAFAALRAAALDAAPDSKDDELKRWREWAQFVYLGGGPVTKTDLELRAGVCEAHDADTQALRATIAELTAAATNP